MEYRMEPPEEKKVGPVQKAGPFMTYELPPTDVAISLHDKLHQLFIVDAISIHFEDFNVMSFAGGVHEELGRSVRL